MRWHIPSHTVAHHQLRKHYLCPLSKHVIFPPRQKFFATATYCFCVEVSISIIIASARRAAQSLARKRRGRRLYPGQSLFPLSVICTRTLFTYSPRWLSPPNTSTHQTFPLPTLPLIITTIWRPSYLPSLFSPSPFRTLSIIEALHFKSKYLTSSSLLPGRVYREDVGPKPRNIILPDKSSTIIPPRHCQYNFTQASQKRIE